MIEIEVYVESKERLKEHPDRDYSFYEVHPCQYKYDITKTLSAADEKALEALMEVAKEKGIIVKIYDLSTLVGKMKARIKGIRKVPTTIIRTQKINGIPTKEEILHIL